MSSIVPLQLARVSNSLKMGVAQRSITSTQRQLLDVQQELATGKRINAPSDDPAGASAALQLRRTLELNDGYAQNLKHATSQLSVVDNTISDVSDLLRQAHDAAVRNAQTTVTPEQREADATIIDNLYRQMLSLANTQYEGVYLFAGDRSTQAPFVSDAGGVKFVGSSQVLQNSYDQSTVLPFMVDAKELFGTVSGRVQGSADLTPSLTATTRLGDVRGAGGSGVRLGSIMIGNGTVSQAVDLSGADSVGDVVDRINAAGVGGVTAAISADGKGIALSGGAGENITVTEMGATTAADLGILTPSGGGAGVAVVGKALNAKVTGLTALSDLNAGAGIDTTSGLVVSNGVKSVTIDLSTVTTVEGLLNAINGAGVGALASINADGTGIDVVNAVQGTSLSIAENGGTTAADLGIRSFSVGTALSELNGGKGVRTASGADIQITRRDGTSFQVDLDGCATVQDAIDAINTADGGAGVTASFSATGNGIVLMDATGGAGALSVKSVNFSQAAQDLGLDGSASGAVLNGKDVNGVEVQGLFANLAKLRDALRSGDVNAITEAGSAIEADQTQVSRVYGEVGARVKEFEGRQERLADQNLAIESLLSTIEDTDYTDAITRFQTLSTALQANLQTTGKLLGLSLLDFLG